MIRFLLPWILASALVGHFGRHRRFGFWGFFFFSLILSPFVGALSLLAGAPAGGARAARAREIAASTAPRHVLAAGSNEALHMSRPVRAGIRSLVVAWVVVVLVFAMVYLLGGAIAPGGIAETSGSGAFLQAIELSFEVGTLGRATSLAEAMSIAGSIERLLVLAILVLMVSRLVAARHVAPLREARESVGRNLQRIEELEESVREQQAAMTEMAALHRRAGPSGPAEIEAARATEPAVPA